MKPPAFRKLAERLLRHPTAPYHEHAVRAEVERICAEHGLECERDAFGNLLVRLQTDRSLRTVALAAHMDHPGFEVVRRLRAREWLLRFRGGVAASYFRKGLPVLLMPGEVKGRLGAPRKGKPPTLSVRAERDPDAPFEFAVWDLPRCAFRGGRIYARACDDLIGVSAILATLIDLKQMRARVNVLGVLSRAEEVGFHGALALAAASARKISSSGRGKPRISKERSDLLPPDSFLLSLETSRELPAVKMGKGVIIRVGDRASVFASSGTRFLSEVAEGLAEKKKGFVFQRALMSGGTCEATAYQEFGFESTAVCVALGNYHNCGESNKIEAEFVDLQDACGMVLLLAEAARRIPDYKRLTGKLTARLQKLLLEAQRNLPRNS